ncbi:hypothetical protein MM236_01405 [Belliella sp. DSM 107340]|uniref:Lipoprotein n=1 Tax=Belliella calami TaxID=2923436 RepID=A0ABS9UJ14_9BACT|nr:hypothetical protein [Belliella calami]MCH7396617.1 hypothetical protein [Belliella calami]
MKYSKILVGRLFVKCFLFSGALFQACGGSNDGVEYLGAMRNKAHLSSFFPINDSTMAMYNSRLPNEQVFESTFPAQPRFFIANDSEEIEKQDLGRSQREAENIILVKFRLKDF